MVFKRTGDYTEIALIGIKGGAVWTLPKGLVDKGESPEETALREVSEETGLKGRILCPIEPVSYWYYIKDENVKCKKTVFYYLIEYIGGNIEDHDDEVEETRWVRLDEAESRLTYKGDKEVLRKAIGMLKDFQSQNLAQ